jgi:predicted RNA-binding Zn-ribbon protein involved in translation (DUF1610 family)
MKNVENKMIVEVSCPNIAYGGKVCDFVFQSNSEYVSVKCPACGQPVNVKKLVEDRKYRFVGQ